MAILISFGFVSFCLSCRFDDYDFYNNESMKSMASFIILTSWRLMFDLWQWAPKTLLWKPIKKLCPYYIFLWKCLVKIMDGRICNVLKSKWNLKKLGSNNWRIHLCYIFWTYVVYTVKFDILYVPFHLALLQLNEHNFSYDNEKKKID